MKKIITIFCFMLLTVSFIPATTAKAITITPQPVSSATTVQKLGNGDTIITQMTTTSNNSSASTYATKKTVSGSKTVTYRNSKGNVLWTFILNASYTYNGSSATCISVSTSSSVNETAWKLSNITKSKSSNIANASVTAKHYLLGVPVTTVTEKLTLKCSASGKLS
ncbi:MAG: hypothetical protein NC124_16835 [Clostridium sp.]|nr:hypothetical protein [Clostridium sp.]